MILYLQHNFQITRKHLIQLIGQQIVVQAIKEPIPANGDVRSMEFELDSRVIIDSQCVLLPSLITFPVPCVSDVFRTTGFVASGGRKEHPSLVLIWEILA